jgi:murein DD-endopeptidase MepM/ murein hydrolase activator NlpD
MLRRGSPHTLHKFAKILTLLLGLSGLASAASAPNAVQSVSWSPATIASGSPCLFKVTLATAPARLAGIWQQHPIVFFPAEDHHVWYALAGVDVETKPGTYKLELTATLPGGEVEQVQRDVVIASAKYKTEVLRVPQKYVKPDAQTLARIEVDKQLKKTAFAREIAVAEWSGRFDVPIGTKPSEGFGTRRTFNGELASIHRGMDYHAAPGTPVEAANAGEVVLARELFYEGNCVILNHGQQFLTIYMHLSYLSVKEGEHVQKGQEVGLSGATGRATGPHLHVAVRWQNAYLDPAQLWLLPLPKLDTADQTAASAH